MKFKIRLFYFFKAISPNIYCILVLLILFTRCEISKMKIIVPKGYHGAVCLILSNVVSDELVIDTNGIGYINEETYNSIKLTPLVFDVSGKDLSSNCVGYTPSVFWARGYFGSSESKVKIKYLTFEIVPDNLKGQKQYYSKELFKLVDTLKLK